MKNIYEIIPCVIIAGGKGKRMGGKEKALVNLLDRPLISYIIEKVSGKAAPIALNINTNFEKFKKFGYEILEDPIKGHLGPLVGVLASLNWARKLNQKWVLTLPCDTPFLPKDLVESLIKAKNENIDLDLVVAKSRGFNHPTIALWKTDNNLILKKAIEKDIRKIDIFTSQLKTSYLDFDNIENSTIDPFTNLNSPNDLLIAKQILGKLPIIFGLAGWSGSGKTTLCTRLIKNFAIIQENNKEEEKSLYEILEIFAKNPLSKCDIIIVEGYKKEDIPKIEVFRSEIGKPFLHTNDETIFAIASEQKINAKIPYLDLNNISSITQFIIDKFKIT